jgi:hypothetical protein
VRLVLLAYAALTGALAVAIALFQSAGATDPLHAFAWVAGISFAATGSLVALTGVWTATGAYAAVFWCFHFGLIAPLAIGSLTPGELSPWDEPWVLGPFAADASMLAAAGSLAFAAGACFVYSRRYARGRAADTADRRTDATHGYGLAGAMLVFLALAAWSAIVVSTGGVTGFFASYEDYLQSTADFGTALAVIWQALGCGIVLAMTGKPGWHRTSATVVFTCFALVALPLGLRSEVMFPTVAMLIALARSGWSLTPVKAAAFALALFLFIPIIRDVRASGLRSLPDVALAVPRLDALVEMGGSLHPVEEVVRWHAEGEPYEGGNSYWAPFERAAARLLPGIDSSAAEDDFRLMNVLVLDRVGAIGFSPVAEAYRNFGPIGVVIVLALLGMALGAIDALRDRTTAVLAIATVYTPLLINVRNSFVSVPAQCAAGIVIVVGVAVARHVAASVSGSSYARAPYLRSEI